MLSPPYTKEEDELLTELWYEGHKTRRIAEILSYRFGIPRTKNSVIGRVRRANLVHRPSPIVREEPEFEPIKEIEFKPLTVCAEPGCHEPVERGSYCCYHAEIYYQKRKTDDDSPVRDK